MGGIGIEIKKLNSDPLSSIGSCKRVIGRKLKAKVVDAFSDNKKVFMTNKIRVESQISLDRDIRTHKKHEDLYEGIYNYRTKMQPEYKS